MAINRSQVHAEPDRRQRRRLQTIQELLDHAIAIMSEQGVGALTVAEVARRIGVKGPSLYKYVPSLYALYDALFARGQMGNLRAVEASIEGVAPGLERIRAGFRATVEWVHQQPGPRAVAVLETRAGVRALSCDLRFGRRGDARSSSGNFDGRSEPSARALGRQR